MSKKLIGIVASFALVLSMAAVNSASALTAGDIAMLQAAGIISASQAASLNASLSPSVSSGYSFAKDLTVGSRGADVTALQNMLGVSPATGYFGSLTKAALIKFQLSKGISPAAGYFGPKTRGVANASAGPVSGPVSGPMVTGTDLKVSLAPTSPVTGAVVAGSAIANLAEYTFTNTSAVSAVVTNVTLQRMGVSDDTTLSNVYLYQGAKRLTDSATVSSGKITFNAPMGLFTVPAGSSMVVAVRSDIINGNSGQRVSVSLTGVSSNVPVGALYPVSGAEMTVVTATTMTTAAFTATTTPSGTSADPQTEYVMWQSTLQIGNHDAKMSAFSLRQIGSVANSDLGNFKLYVDGSQVGATVPALDSNGYASFDLSASPKALTQTSHIIKMVGDIIGGSNKTFSFSLRKASDVMVMDSQLGINVLVTASGGAGSIPMASGDQAISSGTLTITKKTDSPSGNVTKDASSVVLGRFEFKAAGEAMKVETLNVKFASGDVGFGALRNGMLFVNGSQIGSTADIASTSAGTQFNLGSSLVVYPGTPVLVEVKADIFDNSGTNDVSDGDTITASFVAGASNVQRMVSLSYASSLAAAGNQITVSIGALALTKSSAYSNKTVVVPQTAMKLGEYVLSTNSTEDINLNTLTLRFDGTGASSTASTVAVLSDVYMVYGNKITSVKATVGTGDNAYAINHVMPANSSLNIAVYGTVAATAGPSDVIATKLNVSGQTVSSGQTAAPSAAVNGQTVAVTAGSLSVSKDASSPVSDLLVVGSAGSMTKVASYKFEALSDDYTITELALSIAAGSVGNVSGFTLKNGSSVLKDFQAVDSLGFATSTLSFLVPANSSKILDVYANLNTIGTPNNATTSSAVQASLVYYKKQSSGGVQSTATSSTLLGNSQYVFKSKPTVNVVALPSTDLTNASKIARFSVTADAAGSIAWNEISIPVTKTVGRVALTLIKLFDESTGLEVAGAFNAATTTLSGTSSTAATLTFIPTAEEQIGAGASKTYYVRATVTTDGTLATGDNVTTSIVATGAQAGSKAYAAVGTSAFKWSDMSVSPHSTLTPDWNTDYLVKNMSSLDSQKIQY
jgi:hypothetical protein